MKKILSLIIAITPLLGFAETGATFTELEGGYQYGGYQPLDISSDGRLVCGATFVGPYFVSDWKNQNTWSPASSHMGELRSITTGGIAVGMGSKVDFNAGASLPMRLSSEALNVRGGLIDAISDDGSIITGLAYIQDDPLYYAAYWENGECHLLPIPTEEETGWRIYGSRARFISDDGSVIAGYLVDRLSTYPMIFWTRQDDGSYRLHPVCLDYFCDSRDNDKKYVKFCPYAMSPNGKYIVLLLRETQKSGYITTASILALYDVETGKIIETVENRDQGITRQDLLQVWDHGVANDGTIVGWFEGMTGRIPFIVTPEDMTPYRMRDFFEEIEQLTYLDDDGDNAVSCISADARYIAGCGWHYDKATDEAQYIGYVIERSQVADSGVDTVAEGIEDGRVNIYSIDGRLVKSDADESCLTALSPGLYIVKGRKIVVR